MAKFLKFGGSLFVVLIAAYLGTHYWIRWKNTVHDDVSKVSSLVDCEPNSVRAITIRQLAAGANEELVFERVDKAAPGVPSVTAYAQAEWRFVKPASGEADATLLRRIASTACELYDPILLRDGEMQPAEPNAKRSARTLELSMSTKNGARKISFEFGSTGADRLGTVLFREEGGNTRTARITDRLREVSSLAPENYVNLRVVKTEADNIQTATLKIDGKERFTLERLGADWKLLEGGKDKGAASEEANRFVNRITSLKALGVLESSYGPDRCRTGNAKAIFELHGVAGREETVRFDYGRGGEIAACSTSGTMKFRVHRDLVKYLDVPAKSLALK